MGVEKAFRAVVGGRKKLAQLRKEPIAILLTPEGTSAVAGVFGKSLKLELDFCKERLLKSTRRVNLASKRS